MATGNEPSSQPDLPTLEHGVPEPEVYLPGTPPWVWGLVAAGVILLIVFIVWLARRLKGSPAPVPPPLRNHYKEALSALDHLEGSLENQPLNEVASETSLIVRRYLASTSAEPALFQTIEEFEARQIALPKEATTLLRDLNAAKYSRSSHDPSRAREFIKRSQDCLKTIDSARHLTS